jgi:hypothetical protein
LINGWVDIAKDAWIFNIQGNKEVSPILLFMVQSGVPIDEAIYFVSNPLIRQYVKEQKKAKSALSKALGGGPEEANFYRSHARDKVLTDEKNNFNINSVDPKKLNDLTKNYLSKIKKFDVNTLKENAKDKNHVVDFNDRAVFLHYLEIEKMTEAVRDVKMRTNVDTSRDVSLFAAEDRLSLLEELKEDGRLPIEIVEKIQTESPIGSFFIQDFQIKLLGDAFPLRNHSVLNDYLKENMTDGLKDATYGDREKAIASWKSDLINFIFQNELRYFDIENREFFWGREIVNQPSQVNLQSLKYGAFVKYF